MKITPVGTKLFHADRRVDGRTDGKHDKANSHFLQFYKHAKKLILYKSMDVVLQIISCQSLTAGGVQLLQPFVPAIWQQLFRHCECGEEGTRNVVAECLGKLTLIDPASLLPRLQESLVSDSALMRTTVVTAVKFTISDQVLKCDLLHNKYTILRPT